MLLFWYLSFSVLGRSAAPGAWGTMAPGFKGRTGTTETMMGRYAWACVLLVAACWLMSGCSSEPPPPVSEPAARIEHFVRKELGALTEVKAVSARKQGTGPVYQVTVKFVPVFSTSWDADRIMESIEFNVMNVVYGVFGAGIEVGEAAIEGYISVVDGLGNTSEVVGYRAKMPNRMAKRINWENRLQVSPRRLGLVDYIHPLLLN